MDRVRIKPAEGRLIRDPKSFEKIPVEGKMVDAKSPYWLRRLNAGDVIIMEKQEKKITKKKNKSSKGSEI